MKTRASRLFRRSIPLAAVGVLLVVLTACTGRGGGQLPPDGVAFTGSASIGFSVIKGKAKQMAADFADQFELRSARAWGRACRCSRRPASRSPARSSRRCSSSTT